MEILDSDLEAAARAFMEGLSDEDLPKLGKLFGLDSEAQSIITSGPAETLGMDDSLLKQEAVVGEIIVKHYWSLWITGGIKNAKIDRRTKK